MKITKQNFEERLRQAKNFATNAHHGQEYSKGRPYTYHLASVELVLRRFEAGIVPQVTEEQQRHLLISAWLHDVVEDTHVTNDMVKELFGDEVAGLVYAVTNEHGPNRAARHALTYPKIAGNTLATKLKLADRIANVEESVQSQSPQLGMYRKEHEEFERMLRKKGQHVEMWHLIYDLLFPKADIRRIDDEKPV